MGRAREGVAGLGACLLLVWGCANDAPSGQGTAGSSTTAGADASSGGSSGGGSPAAGGGGGALSSGGSSPKGGSSAAGSSGAGGSAAPATELAVSNNACDPACPEQQYCALEEIDCSGKPCLVRAICRERPARNAEHKCGKMREKCLCDTRGDCTQGNPNWPGMCVCSENPYPCDELVLDERPSVCECVPDPAPSTCLGAKCPDNFHCEVIIGKQYCFTTAPN
jgi:hypothetical protein